MTSDAQRQSLIARNTTHGLSHSERPTYRSWKDARGRCRNPNDSDYRRYGGRGIKVCERWDDFTLFFADMGSRPSGMTLDRIDRDGDYEPANCRWADEYQQANNRCNNHPITIDGVTKNLINWCKDFGVDQSKVRYRLKVGYSIQDAFSSADHRT